MTMTAMETTRQEVEIPIGGGLTIVADACVPHQARSIIIFAHGSGSGRKSPRNQYVAEMLMEGGHATLLADLLTAPEAMIDERTAHLRFDIPLLTARVIAVVDWLGRHSHLATLRIGIFGASTGAAAALDAAAARPREVAAVVSRGGRPDLAGQLESVVAPTLLIVGAEDPVVVGINREALQRIPAPRRLDLVPRATHLFEEPGTLAEVALLARGWFDAYLR